MLPCSAAATGGTLAKATSATDQAAAWPDVLVALVAVAGFVISLVTLWLQLSDRKRRDAEAVDAWITRDGTALEVRNGGRRPIREVAPRLMVLGGPWPTVQDRVSRIGPGESEKFLLGEPIGDSVLGADLAGVSVQFSLGKRRWTRTAGGELKRVKGLDAR